MNHERGGNGRQPVHGKIVEGRAAIGHKGLQQFGQKADCQDSNYGNYQGALMRGSDAENPPPERGHPDKDSDVADEQERVSGWGRLSGWRGRANYRLPTGL